MNKTYGPYSPFTTTDNLIFTAGQIGAKDGHAPADIASQTALVLKNLESVLIEAGSNLSQVVKTTVFLTSMDHFESMNAVYAKVFEVAGSRPARSTVAVGELPRVADQPLLVEIEAVAQRSNP